MSVDIETVWLEENGVTPENLPLLIQEGTLTIDCLPEGALRTTLIAAQKAFYEYASAMLQATTEVVLAPLKAHMRKVTDNPTFPDLSEEGE